MNGLNDIYGPELRDIYTVEIEKAKVGRRFYVNGAIYKVVNVLHKRGGFAEVEGKRIA